MLNDNIIYKNRSFYFLASAATGNLAVADAPVPPRDNERGPGDQHGGRAVRSPRVRKATSRYRDVGDGSPTPGANHLPTRSTRCSPMPALSAAERTSTPAPTSPTREPRFLPSSTATGRAPSRGNSGSCIPSLNPVQNFTMLAAATEDEGGNWIDVRFGPLSLSDSSAYQNAGVDLPNLGDYHLPLLRRRLTQFRMPSVRATAHLITTSTDARDRNQ